MISLDEDYESIRNLFTALDKENEHYHLIIKDFHAPNIAQFSKLHQIVTKVSISKKIAIHCIQGLGRTGTMLASLVLRALMEKKYIKNPKSFINDEIKFIHKIKLGQHSKVNSMTCSSEVYNTIEKVRCLPNSKESIETQAQVAALLELEKQLAHYYKTKYQKT